MSELHSNNTKNAEERVERWYEKMLDAGWTDEDEMQVEMEDILASHSTYELLKKLKPIPFYRFLVYYLADHHKADLDKMGYAVSTDAEFSDCVEAICSVMEDAKCTGKPKQEQAWIKQDRELRNLLVELMMDDLVQNGVAKRIDKAAKAAKSNAAEDEPEQPEKEYDYSVIVDLKTGERKIMGLNSCRTTLFGIRPKMSEKVFFMLALGLHMPLEDIELFLRKAFRRTGIDFWNIEEVLLYLCTECNIQNTDKPTFYQNALQAYRTLSASPDEKDTAANADTRMLRNEAEELVKQLKAKALTTTSVEFSTFLQRYKDLTQKETSCVRTRTKVFSEQKEKLTENIRTWQAKSKQAEDLRQEWQFLHEKWSIIESANTKIAVQQEDGKISRQLCAFLYHMDKDADMSKARGNAALFGEHGFSTCMQLFAPALDGHAFNDTFLTRAGQNKTGIDRDQLMTMAFLAAMSELEMGIREERITARGLTALTYVMQPVSEVLKECGFQDIYLANPYDCLLLSLCACDEPLQMYRTLWSCYGYYKNLQTGKGD